MKKIAKKNIYVAAAGIILISAGLAWLAFFWQFGKIRKKSEEIQKQMLDSLVQNERSQKLYELKRELVDVEKEKMDMGKMLIDKDNAVDFLKSLERISAETKNTIQIGVFDLSKMKSNQKKAPVKNDDDDSKENIQKETQTTQKNQPKSESGDYSNQIGFSIVITGEYQDFIDFLTKLENLPNFVKIYNFDIVAEQKKNASPSSSPTGQQGSSRTDEGKNIKAILTIGVFTNGSKQ